MPLPLLSSLCRHLLSAGLALCCTAVVAAPVKDKYQQIHKADDVKIVQGLHQDLERFFLLDKALPLDPELRTAADAISQAYLAQLDQLLARWLAEERGLQVDAEAPNAAVILYLAMTARAYNEIAFWHLAAGDAAYEAATLEVLKTTPGACVSVKSQRFDDFARRILRIQAMPIAQREAALATERQLLDQWGQTHPAIPPIPEPLPQDNIAKLIKRWQAGGPRPALALPPFLASKLLSERADYRTLRKDEKCALQRWWLKQSLQQGVTPAQALSTFRYATMVGISDSFGAPEVGAKDTVQPDKPFYPPAATRYGVTGTVNVRLRLDSAGQPLDASIVERKIDVLGIRNTRPVAFEQIFDAAALSFAMAGRSYQPQGDGFTTLKLVWNLDGVPATKKALTQGAKP